MKHYFSSLKDTLLHEKNWLPSSILAGIIGSVCAWSIFGFPLLGILLSNFTLLPLFMSGFVYGYKGLGISAGIFLGIPFIFGMREMSLSVLFTLLPAFFAYAQSMRHRVSQGKKFFYPEGRIIVSLVFFFIIGLVLYFLIWQNIWDPKGEITSLEQAFFQFFSSFFKELPLKEAPDPRILSIVAKLFPAIICISWFLVVFFNMHLALRLLAKWEISTHRPPFIFEKIILPNQFIWALIGCSAFIWIKGDIGFIALNSISLILCAYVLLGISFIQFTLLHQNQSNLTVRKIFLGIFYISMVLFPWILLIVAVLGIFDSLLGLKEKRFKRIVKMKSNIK